MRVVGRTGAGVGGGAFLAISGNRAETKCPVKVEETKGISRVMGNTKGGSSPTSS